MPRQYTPYRPLEERFWSKVDYDKAGCWLWTASLNEWGYGWFGVYDGERWRMRGAHRVAYELAFGPIPEGLRVLHTCDDPRCVNPEHLFLGDQFDNMRDMAAKGRGNLQQRPREARFGEACNLTKLTAERVREIRERYALGGVRQCDLAAEFGVSQGAVSLLIRRQTWRDVR
jgi:hypothetical protein